MLFQTIMSVIAPKDRVFYDFFFAAGSNLKVMGELLTEFASETDPTKKNNLYLQIEEYEGRNDEVTHALFNQLGRNFITPISREDIHELSKALDDVADHIFAVSRSMQLHNIDILEHGMIKMTEAVSKSTNQIFMVIKDLKTLRKRNRLMAHINLINLLEGRAEDLFDMSIHSLFDLETDFKKLMIKREIYSLLEQTGEKCKNVARVLKQIIIRTS